MTNKAIEALERIAHHRGESAFDSRMVRRWATEAIAALRAESGGDGCTWTEDPDYSHWVASCGMEWTFSADGPKENGIKFCPGCGKPVIITPPEAP